MKLKSYENNLIWENYSGMSDGIDNSELSILSSALEQYIHNTGNIGAKVKIQDILERFPNDEEVQRMMEDALGHGWEDEFVDEGDYMDGEEDSEVIMSMEPMGEVEPEFEMDEDCDEDDDDHEVVLHSLRKLVKRGEELQELCKSKELESWMIAKIIKAEDYISDVWDRLDDDADFANDGFEDSDNLSL